MCHQLGITMPLYLLLHATIIILIKKIFTHTLCGIYLPFGTLCSYSLILLAIIVLLVKFIGKYTNTEKEKLIVKECSFPCTYSCLVDDSFKKYDYQYFQIGAPSCTLYSKWYSKDLSPLSGNGYISWSLTIYSLSI